MNDNRLTLTEDIQRILNQAAISNMRIRRQQVSLLAWFTSRQAREDELTRVMHGVEEIKKAMERELDAAIDRYDGNRDRLLPVPGSDLINLEEMD